MANQYDTNLKLQAIADAIGDTQSSGLIQALEDIADAVVVVVVVLPPLA